MVIIMAMSNFTLNRIINDLTPRMLGAKISKIVKISSHDFSFFLYAQKQESLIMYTSYIHGRYSVKMSNFPKWPRPSP